jgi:hypothetical protein
MGDGVKSCIISIAERIHSAAEKKIQGFKQTEKAVEEFAEGKHKLQTA